MAKLGKTRENVSRVIAILNESHLHEQNANLGFDIRWQLRSLIGCDLIEIRIVRTFTLKSTKGNLVEINVYGITEKGTQKLHLIDNPPTPIEKPTAVAKASNAIKRSIAHAIVLHFMRHNKFTMGLSPVGISPCGCGLQ